MVQLTDASGNECWLRVDQIKVISVVKLTDSRGERCKRTEVRLSVEKDGYLILVLESPREIAQRMQGNGTRSVSVSSGRDTSRLVS